MINYYILRDRIPFFLTMIWLFRYEIWDSFETDVLYMFGYYLLTVTNFCLLVSGYLLFTGGSLDSIVYFKWSFPSPIQWSILTLLLVDKLTKKGIHLFEAYYISLLTSLGGGWLWEILYGLPFWIKSNFASWNWYKYNPYKVFFFEFQIFCIPLVYLILRENFRFRKDRIGPLWLSPILVNFYLLGPVISPFFHKLGNLGGNTYWSWIIRIPTILVLYYWIDGVKID